MPKRFDNYEWHKRTIEEWEKREKEGTLQIRFKEKLPKLKQKYERMEKMKQEQDA